MPVADGLASASLANVGKIDSEFEISPDEIFIMIKFSYTDEITRTLVYQISAELSAARRSQLIISARRSQFIISLDPR